MKKLMFIWTLLIVSNVLLMPSCSTSEPSLKDELTGKNSILSHQRLTVRPNYVGVLTNRAGENVLKHDLFNKAKRIVLRELRFACKIGSEAFHICGDRPGFCRNTLTCLKWKRRLFKKKKCIKYAEKYLSIKDDFKYLLSVKAVCMSRIIYPNFVRKI